MVRTQELGPTCWTRPTLSALLIAATLAACEKTTAPPPAATFDAATEMSPAPADSSDSLPPPGEVRGTPSGAGTPYADSFAQIDSKIAEKKKSTVRYKNGVLVSDDSAPVIKIGSEFDNTRNGKVSVPAYPGDVLYLSATIETEAGTPLKQKTVQIASSKNTSIVPMSDRANDEGYLEFHMVAGAAGQDLVTVSAAGVKTDFYIDVSDPPRGEWMGELDLTGVTSWDLLMSARVQVGVQNVSAQFPPPLQQLQRRRLRLAGFMLPLGVEEKQKHFLLSANPPSCFFHPPGGPSSVVEVFADKGIAMSFDPLVVEGEFELVPSSDSGMLYKLKASKLIAIGG